MLSHRMPIRRRLCTAKVHYQGKAKLRGLNTKSPVNYAGLIGIQSFGGNDDKVGYNQPSRLWAVLDDELIYS